MCKDVKSGYNYSCHHGGNDDSSNHIVSFSSVEFVIDECKVSEVNRLCQGSTNRLVSAPGSKTDGLSGAWIPGLWDPNQNEYHHHGHA